MNALNLEYIVSIHPAVWAGFFFPLVLALLLWVKFYCFYDADGLKNLTVALQSIIKQGNLAEGCSRQNIEILEGAMNMQTPASFRAAWNRMRQDSDVQYKGDFIPEAEAYFDLESLILIPGGRKLVAALWGGFGILALFSLISPALGYFFSGNMISQTALILGIWCLFNLCVGQAIFVFVDQKVFQQALRDYDQFINLFNRVVPVAGTLSGAALLMEATARNQEAFQSSADKIAAQFDTFSSEVVIPALQESTALLINDHLVPAVNRIEASLSKAMEAFSLRQEEEMKIITDAFADKLAGTLDHRLKSLSEMLGIVENGLVSINNQLEKSLSGMDTVVIEQKLTLKQTSDILIKANEIQLAVNEKQDIFNNQVGTLGESINRMEKNLSGMSQVFGTAQENLTTNVKDLQEQYTGLNHLITDMMLNITQRMNDAMANAGREIGKGIQDATADNAQAITDLTEQAAKLRENYDTYFNRLEDSTKQTLDDMDFHVQNITVKMTEEITSIFKDILEQNTQVLEQYKESTTNLLQSFDEQARSISLYAKEMNYDINVLSASMKDSVDVFSKQIQEGVNLSIGEFDSGLAELSLRIANTVESIADAVENLPAAILGKK